MNVVRLATTRGRGRGNGRGKSRDETTAPGTNNRVLNALPKYEFLNHRRPLVNFDESTSTTQARTPKNVRRVNTTSSSTFPTSATRRRGLDTGTSAGQLSTGSADTEPDTCNILAITSGRGDARGEVGMAVIDIRQPHMILHQISDCNTYANTLSMINAMQPIEIIIPDTMGERNVNPNGLYRSIREKFPKISISEVARMHFHDSEGLERIKTHCADEFANVQLYIKQKYYALGAAAALLKYVEYIQHIVYAGKSMRIDFHGLQNSAMIDLESAQNLELVTSKGGPAKFSLLESLDRCSTPMGRRLLRVSILQPPADLTIIQNRQACIDELVANRSFHAIVQPVVKRFYGASRLLSLAMLTSQVDTVLSAEKNLNYILLLKTTINVIPELDAVLATGQSLFFKRVCANLKDSRFQTIKEQILQIIHPDARSVNGYTSSTMQRCFAIRSGVSDMLDVARQVYCELIDEMQELVEKLAIKYNLGLSLGCNAKLGYHIEMSAPRLGKVSEDDFPSEFIEIHQQKNTIFMTTQYLMVLSQHCKEACEELHLMSNVLMNKTLITIREQIGCLLKLNDDIAELDIVLSLAQVSSIPDFVKPVFGSKLELINSRHPVMDIWGVDSSRVPVSNDVVASVRKNFHTITGPNMSGKSVYLKQIVLLQIMAQIGCYVPASKAQFRITDRIFCRMCSRFDSDCDSSNFVLEIKEIQYILQSITPCSLVILDELCRGTTVEEGTSVAWAIAEKLICTSQAFIFNATHFLYLTRLEELYCNVTNHYLQTESKVSSTGSYSSDARLVYTHKLMRGVASVWNYGIALARSTGLSRDIVIYAQQVADDIATSIKPFEIGTSSINNTEKLCYDFVTELAEILENGTFTIDNIMQIAHDMNVPNVNVGREKIVNKTVKKSVETSSDSSRNLHGMQKTHERQLELKRLSKFNSFSTTDEIKKPRLAEKSQYFGLVLSQTSETEFSRKYPSSNGSMKNFNNLKMPISPTSVSSISTVDQPSQAISINLMQEFTSPNSTMTSINYSSQWTSSVVEERTDQPIHADRFSVVTSSSKNHTSGESLPTPVAQKMARDKEADIFRIIGEQNEKQEYEKFFYHSFMNPANDTNSIDN